MYFKYTERYSLDNKITPNIMLGYYDDNQSKKIMTEFSFNQFFDRLPKEIELELEKILNSTNKEYINQEVWFSYAAIHNLVIPSIGKRYDKRISKYNTKEENISLIYSKNKKIKKLSFDNPTDFLVSKPLTLFDKLAKNGHTQYDLILHKEANYQNDMELLYLFLECLFASHQTFYIRKCKYCKKYYVETLYSTPYCKRTYELKGKFVACGKIKSTIKKTNEFTKFRTTYRNFLENQLSVGNKLYYVFLDERDDIIEKCIETRDLTLLNNFVANFKNKYNI